MTPGSTARDDGRARVSGGVAEGRTGRGDREGRGEGPEHTHQSENLRSGTSLGARRLGDAFLVLVLLRARDLVLLEGGEEVRHRSGVATLERAREDLAPRSKTAPRECTHVLREIGRKQVDFFEEDPSLFSHTDP